MRWRQSQSYLLSKVYREGVFKEINTDKSINYARCGAELGNMQCISDLYNTHTDVLVKEQEKEKPDKNVIKELEKVLIFKTQKSGHKVIAVN